jgi:hypothetical protein
MKIPTILICPACAACLLPEDPKVDSFHADCYSRWLARLYAEYEGKLVKVKVVAA